MAKQFIILRQIDPLDSKRELPVMDNVIKSYPLYYGSDKQAMEDTINKYGKDNCKVMLDVTNDWRLYLERK